MKERFGRVGAKEPGDILIKSVVAGFALVMIALAMLCTYAVAKEMTADDWTKKGEELSGKGVLNESIQAYEKALALYNESIEQNPTDAKTWTSKGNVLFNLALSKSDPSLFNESIESYDRALQIDPNFADAWFGMGVALNGQGSDPRIHDKEALEALDKALQIDPNNPRYWEGKGRVLFMPGSYNESLEAFNKAINLWPANQTDKLSGTWLLKGFSLLRAGMPNDAINAFDEVLQINSKDVDAWSFKGDALRSMDKYNESLESYTKAIQINPENSEVWEKKGEVLDSLGKHEEAVKAYQRAIEILDNTTRANHNDSNAWNYKGHLFMKIDRYEDALKAYDMFIETAHAVYPIEVAVAWYNEGLALKSLGRDSEADMAFTKAKEHGYEGPDKK